MLWTYNIADCWPLKHFILDCIFCWEDISTSLGKLRSKCHHVPISQQPCLEGPFQGLMIWQWSLICCLTVLNLPSCRSFLPEAFLGLNFCLCNHFDRAFIVRQYREAQSMTSSFPLCFLWTWRLRTENSPNSSFRMITNEVADDIKFLLLRDVILLRLASL